MFNAKNNRRFWLLISVLAACFYIVKHASFRLVEQLYLSKQFEFLNFFSKGTGEMPLGFYQGELTNYLFGPLQMVIAGVVFLLIALKYYQKSSMMTFGLAVLAYFVFTRFEVLFYPPYGEAMTGPFTDTVWLYQNNFDYLDFMKQKTYLKGGAQIYPLSIFPIFLVGLMHVIPNTTTFLIVTHLIFFAFSAIIIALIREIGRKIFDDKFALLTALTLLFLPLFQSMSEQLNMEITCAFFAVLCAVFLIEKRLGLACMMAILSLLIKAPGAICCVAVFVVGVVLFYCDGKCKKTMRGIAWGLLAMAAAFFKNAIRNQLIDKDVGDDRMYFLAGWPEISHEVTFWLFALFLVCWAGSLLIRIRQSPSQWRDVLSMRYQAFVMFLMGGLWFVLFLSYEDLLHRYMLLLYPFFIFVSCLSLSQFFQNKKRLNQVIYIVMGCFLVNSHGLIYMNESIRIKRPTSLERSLEYRNYLLLQMKVAREIEEKYSQYTIGAPIGYSESIGIPKLGYVDKQMDVMVYGFQAKLKGIRQFEGLDKENIRKIVWVGLDYNRMKGIKDFPYGPSDHILEKFNVGHNQTVLFHGGIGIEKARIIYEMHIRGMI